MEYHYLITNSQILENTIRKIHDPLIDVSGLCSIDDVSIRAVYIPIADVVFNVRIEQYCVLWYDSYVLPQTFLFNLNTKTNQNSCVMLD